MTDSNDFDSVRAVIDDVKHPVIANADAVAILAMKFLDAVRARIVFQFEQLAGDALVCLGGQSVQFPFR